MIIIDPVDIRLKVINKINNAIGKVEKFTAFPSVVVSPVLLFDKQSKAIE